MKRLSKDELLNIYKKRIFIKNVINLEVEDI